MLFTFGQVVLFFGDTDTTQASHGGHGHGHALRLCTPAWPLNRGPSKRRNFEERLAGKCFLPKLIDSPNEGLTAVVAEIWSFDAFSEHNEQVVAELAAWARPVQEYSHFKQCQGHWTPPVPEQRLENRSQWLRHSQSLAA